MAMVKVVATPCHKEVPCGFGAYRLIDDTSPALSAAIEGLVDEVMRRVRQRGNDMRDDWTIVLSFKSAG